MVLANTMSDLIITVGHCDPHLMVQWFKPASLILSLICFILCVKVHSDAVFDLISLIGHCDLYSQFRDMSIISLVIF